MEKNLQTRRLKPWSDKPKDELEWIEMDLPSTKLALCLGPLHEQEVTVSQEGEGSSITINCASFPESGSAPCQKETEQA